MLLYCHVTQRCIVKWMVARICINIYIYKCVCEILPITGHKGPKDEQMYSSTLPSTSAVDRGGWSASRPGRFTPGKDPVPIVQVAGWAPGPVWTGAENLAPPPGFDPRTVASRYTDWAIAAPYIYIYILRFGTYGFSYRKLLVVMIKLVLRISYNLYYDWPTNTQSICWYLFYFL